MHALRSDYPHEALIHKAWNCTNHWALHLGDPLAHYVTSAARAVAGPPFVVSVYNLA